MQKWTAFMTPGAAHQRLNDRVGAWSLVVKMYEPGAPEPMSSTATSEMRWAMDGRYIEDNTTGSFQGSTFIGHGFVGYDNLKQRYVSVWMDNMGTGISTGDGQWDEATQSFVYTTMVPDFAGGGWMKARSIEKRVDANHYVMQLYQPGPDGEYLSMEIEYARM